MPSCHACKASWESDREECPACGETHLGRISLRDYPPVPPVRPPSKPSQSLLHHLDNCARAGYLYLKYGGGGTDSHAMARGTAFHDFAERATHTLRETGEVQMVPDVARDLMQEVIAERADLAIPTHEQDALRAMAWNFGTGHAIDLPNLVCVETMVELELDGWTIRGKLDRAERVGNEGFVHDYKTSRNIPSQERFEQAFQPPFYGLLLCEGVYAEPDERSEQKGIPAEMYGKRVAEGIGPVTLIEHYPRFTYDETGDLVNNRRAIGQAQLADFKETVRATLRRLERGLETGIWNATPSSHCDICPMQSECPIPAEILNEYAPIETPEQANDYAEWVLVFERALRGIKKQMRAYVESEDGPPAIVLGDYEFTLTKRESRRVKNHDKLEAALRKGGAKAEDYVGASASTRFDKRRIDPPAKKAA